MAGWPEKHFVRNAGGGNGRLFLLTTWNLLAAFERLFAPSRRNLSSHGAPIDEPEHVTAVGIHGANAAKLRSSRFFRLCLPVSRKCIREQVSEMHTLLRSPRSAFFMLTGRLHLRRVGTVLLGCFLLSGLFAVRTAKDGNMDPGFSVAAGSVYFGVVVIESPLGSGALQRKSCTRFGEHGQERLSPCITSLPGRKGE